MTKHSQIGLQTADFPLVLENSTQGIKVIESFEEKYGKKTWQRLMLDFMLYAGKAALMLGRSEVLTADAIFKKMRSRFPTHIRAVYGF